MKRRSLLRAAAGLPLAAQVQISPANAQAPAAEPAKLTFETPDAAGTGVRRFFSPDELQAMQKLGSLLMPSSEEIPGATEAGAAEFLDFLLSQSDAKRQSLYRNGVAELQKRSMARGKKRFAELPDTDAAALLEPLSRPWTYSTPSDPFEAFLRSAKDDFWTATANSREFSTVMSKRRRGASGTGLYWRPIE